MIILVITPWSNPLSTLLPFVFQASLVKSRLFLGGKYRENQSYISVRRHQDCHFSFDPGFMDFQQCSEIYWIDWYFKYTDFAITTKWLDLQPFSHPYIKEKYLGSHTFPWVYPESTTISRLSTKIYVLSFTSWGPSILNCLGGLRGVAL